MRTFYNCSKQSGSVAPQKTMSMTTLASGFAADRNRSCFYQSALTRIIHEPLAAIAYLTSSPGLSLIADLDVLQYACARLTALSPGSNAIYAISLQSS
jgi:hypothetical protein